MDVLVVGTGFAGLAAAIEAKIAGGSVLVLEKTKGFGGNSAISEGGVAAAGTPMQQAAGIQDSPERLFRDMMRAGLGLNHPDLVGTVAENSADTLQWTIDELGVKYKDRVDQFGGHSVRRGHTTINRSGGDIIRPMLDKAKALGVKIRTRTLMQQVLLDGSGAVEGVCIRRGYTYPDTESGIVKYVKIKKALVLAAGGFGNDIDFRSCHDPRLDDRVDSTNKFSATAESLREAMRIGAMTVQLSHIQLGPWACPDEKGYGVGPDFASYIAFPYGVLVDPATGRRIVSELADRKTRADAILETGHPCIAIADATGVRNSGYSIDRCLKKGIVREFDSVADVATHYDIPLDALTDTLAAFNRDIDAGEDRAFGKPILPKATPIATPPFYAIRLWPKIHYTMGGVMIDADARVLDLHRRPIKGLYAAGEFTGGIHGACRLGSCAIMECLVFGRIAGRNAAHEKNRDEKGVR